MFVFQLLDVCSCFFLFLIPFFFYFVPFLSLHSICSISFLQNVRRYCNLSYWLYTGWFDFATINLNLGSDAIFGLKNVWTLTHSNFWIKVGEEIFFICTRDLCGSNHVYESGIRGLLIVLIDGAMLVRVRKKWLIPPHVFPIMFFSL